MNRMIKKKSYVIDFLSPVHIGSGQKLQGYDIAVLQNQLIRFDINYLLERLGSDNHALDIYIRAGASEVLKMWKKEEQEACKIYSIKWNGREPREVLEHISDSFKRPYLPGSSLKGAIRTAIVWSFLQDGKSKEYAVYIGRDRRREWAGQPLLQTILGKDPNHDLLRALRVFDSSPLPLSGNGTVLESKVAVAEPKGQINWLRGKGNHVPVLRDAFSTWCEYLTRSASGKIKTVIEIDDFLLKGKTAQDFCHSANPDKDLDFQDWRKSILLNWEDRCNDFAKHVATREIEFGKRFNLIDYAHFFEKRLTELQQNKEAVYLIIGWGTGWRSKTVTEAFGESGIRMVRQLFRLGNGEPFPKTRKIVIEQGRPTTPLGWVRLKPDKP